MSWEARYLTCSAVRVSMPTPMVASLSLATQASISAGRCRLWARACLLLDGPFGGEGLNGEAHVHDGGGVAVGGGEVDQAAFAKDLDAAAVGQGEFVDEFADALADVGGILARRTGVESRHRNGRSCRPWRRLS